MNYTESQLREIKMFGMTRTEMDEIVKKELLMSRDTRMMIMSILSDIQENGNISNEDRQSLNFVKFIVDTTLVGKESKWVQEKLF